MKKSLLADRYARALRAAIADQPALEKAAEALHALSHLYEVDATFRSVLANPILDPDKRNQVLSAALKAQGTPVQAAHLVQLILQRNRMALLPAIAQQVERHLDEWSNRVEVSVVTAVPLTPELDAKLVQAVQQFTGKTVRLRSSVDPQIIGGLIVHLWGTFFDFSLRTRLERLKQHLLADENLTYGHQDTRN